MSFENDTEQLEKEVSILAKSVRQFSYCDSMGSLDRMMVKHRQGIVAGSSQAMVLLVLQD